MSACSSTLRALSRSRTPTNKTFLPFLYQTATIQQWKPAAQPIARRHLSRYSRKDDAPAEDVPFENEESLPPALDDLEPARKTTITGSERAAFEKLYRKFNTRGSRQEEKDHEVEIDAIADEYWEPDEEEDPKASLDKIFDEALGGKANAAREWNRSGAEQLRSRKPTENLQSMAEHVLKGTRPIEMRARELRGKKKRKDTSAQAAKLSEARLRERNRIDALLTSARTDRELWETLQSQVFDQIRQLDLDSTGPKSKKPARNTKSTSTSTATDPKILFANYPHHLLTALTTLRTHFPASPLPLSILPTVKSLGRSSYALGATTALYTNLLRTAWVQQSSYPLLTSLLTDMHNGAIEFSPDTLALLDQVLKEFDMARSGRLGREMQMVYGMEQFGEGIREVRRWRQIVAERVGIDLGRREKGTVPVPRRRKGPADVNADAAPSGTFVPLVEGANGVAPEQSREKVDRIDPGVEFGFLSEDASVEEPKADEPGSASTQSAEQAEEKLQQEVKDDIKEEEGKTAEQAEATAKTSSGEPVPWTPS